GRAANAALFYFHFPPNLITILRGEPLSTQAGVAKRCQTGDFTSWIEENSSKQAELQEHRSRLLRNFRCGRKKQREVPAMTKGGRSDRWYFQHGISSSRQAKPQSKPSQMEARHSTPLSRRSGSSRRTRRRQAWGGADSPTATATSRSTPAL